jgi:hypothetical protein
MEQAQNTIAFLPFTFAVKAVAVLRYASPFYSASNLIGLNQSKDFIS